MEGGALRRWPEGRCCLAVFSFVNLPWTIAKRICCTKDSAAAAKGRPELRIQVLQRLLCQHQLLDLLLHDVSLVAPGIRPRPGHSTIPECFRAGPNGSLNARAGWSVQC